MKVWGPFKGLAPTAIPGSAAISFPVPVSNFLQEKNPKNNKPVKGDFNPLWSFFSSSALVLPCDEMFSPYTLATNSPKEPMQPMIAKTETYSCALVVLKALQLSGSRVSQALPTPVGS